MAKLTPRDLSFLVTESKLLEKGFTEQGSLMIKRPAGLEITYVKKARIDGVTYYERRPIVRTQIGPY